MAMQALNASCIIALIASTSVTAQFGPEILINTDGTVTNPVIPADMDGDTDIDLVTTIGLNAHLIWLENMNGDGTTWTYDTLQLDLLFGRFAAADIDDDDDIDVVYHHGLDLELKWRANDGFGNFAPAITIGALGPTGGALTCADITGDPFPELLYGGSGQTLWYNNSAGTFTTKDSLATIGGPPSPVVLVGDMDLDTDPDFVTINWNGSVEIGVNLLGDGTQWQSDWLMGLGFMWFSDEPMVLIDVEPDGDLDVVDPISQNKWLENLAADGGTWPSFEVHDLFDWQHWGPGWCGDLGCGPGADMIWSPYADSLLMQWTTYTAGISDFGPSIALAHPPKGSFTRIADLNGDGSNDLIIGRTDTLAWYANELPQLTGTVTTSLPDILCANGAPYPLPDGTPSGGTWSGVGVDTSFFFRNTVGAGEYALTYTVIDSSGCPISAVDTVEVITETNVEPDSAIDIHCIYQDIQFTGYPAGGTWFGVVDSTGLLDSDCALRPLSGWVAYKYTDTTGAQCYGGGPFFMLQQCYSPIISYTGPYCENDSMQVVTVTGGGTFGFANMAGDFDSTSFTPPPAPSFTGYFDPATHGPGAYPVFASVGGPLGCTGSTTFMIEVNAAPDAQILFDGQYCDGVDTAFIHAWPVGHFSGAASGDDSLGLVLPSTLGNGWHQYSFAVTDTNGCTTLLVDSIEVNAAPNAQILFDGPYCVQEDTAFIHAWPVGHFSGSAFGDDSLGLILPSALDTGWHQFTFAVTDTNGCTTLLVDSFHVEICTGMAEAGGSSITIAPNPAQDVALVWFGDRPADMTLMDAQGRVVWRRERVNSPVRIEIDHLAPGAYQLRVLNDRGEVASERVIVR